MIGSGLVVLPFEFFWSFISRPEKTLTVAEFEVEKSILLNDLLSLRQRALKLEEERPTLANKNFIKNYLQRFWVVALDTESVIVEKEFDKLIKLSNKKKFYDPALYMAKLFIGIFFSFILLIFMVDLCICEVSNTGNYECESDFMGTYILIPITNIGLSCVSTAIFEIFFLTLLYCAYLGNRKLGLRFYSCTFYPLTENETLLNGILYNVITLNFAT
jgi:hypothetical protein